MGRETQVGGNMSAGWLQLKFQDKSVGLVCGAAWVVADGREITPNCGTYSELDCRLREIEEDIVAIRKAAKKEFQRCQGGEARK
jgi:hypothetical protein